MTPRRVYLVDGTHLLYRAYHAIRGFRTSGGLPTNAAYGFLSMIFRLKKEENPDAVVVVFDPKGPTLKHSINPEYKGNRQPPPDDFIIQIPYVHRALKALGIPVLVVPGVEADDVIGTLAARYVSRGDEVRIVTGDKDFCQLVGPGITLLDTMNDKVTGPAQVVEKMGVPPERVIDLLALMGDAVDNLPGVPGLGPKGAAALLNEYGSLKAVLEHSGDVKGKRGEALRQYTERVRGNVPMVTIETALDLPVTEESLAQGAVDRAEAAFLLRELEFSKFLKELDLLDEPEKKADPKPDTPQRAQSFPEWVALWRGGEGLWSASRYASQGLVTTQIEPGNLPDGWPGAWLGLPVKFAGHDFNEFRQQWSALGITGATIGFDTMVAAYLLNPGKRVYEAADLERERGIEPGGPEALLKLAFAMQGELIEKGLGDLYDKIELPLIGVIADMEAEGVRVDRTILEALSSEFEGRIAALEAKMFAQAGEEFNPRSPKDLSRILFETLGLEPVRKTQTGYSTDAAVLEELSLLHELPATLLEHRNLTKLKNSFIDTLPKLVDPLDGRIHASFNQTIAATGRLSSSNPNLQNIPVRGIEGRRIREAFIARDGYVLLSADYSQIEFRVLAHMSGEKALLDMFATGRDIHAETASRLFDVGPLGVTSEMRRMAKTVNFAILYGQSPFGLARLLGVGRDQASRMIKTYFERFPGVKKFLQELVDKARETGETRTYFGRLRPVPEINSRNRVEVEAAQRLAANSPIQGTAADLIKIAMIDAVQSLKSGDVAASLILQVHDELVFEVLEKDTEKAKTIVRAAMEGAAKFAVPLKVEMGTGTNWFAAHGG